MNSRRHRAIGIIGTVVCAAVAYPLALPTVTILGTVAVRHDLGTAFTVAAITGAVLVGLLIVLPRLSRFALRMQRRWARLVFETWKLWQQKRMLATAESRISTSVTDATDLREVQGGETNG